MLQVLSKCANLKILKFEDFNVTQDILLIVGEMQNLKSFTYISNTIISSPPAERPLNFYPIGNLKQVIYFSAYGNIRDEFLFNLIKKCKNIQCVHLTPFRLSDGPFTKLYELT